jgi:hypothetical protein
MCKVSKVPKENRNTVKASLKRKKNKRISQMKLSEFFQSSPLVGIELSRDSKLDGFPFSRENLKPGT